MAYSQTAETAAIGLIEQHTLDRLLSPELMLVDAELAERARALLREPHETNGKGTYMSALGTHEFTAGTSLGLEPPLSPPVVRGPVASAMPVGDGGLSELPTPPPAIRPPEAAPAIPAPAPAPAPVQAEVPQQPEPAAAPAPAPAPVPAPAPAPVQVEPELPSMAPEATVEPVAPVVDYFAADASAPEPAAEEPPAPAPVAPAEPEAAPAVALQPLPLMAPAEPEPVEPAAVQPVVELPAISPEPVTAVEPEPVAPVELEPVAAVEPEPAPFVAPVELTPEPVDLAPSVVEPLAEAEPVHVQELEELFAPKRTSDFRVVVRMKEGEGVEVGSFRDFGTAMEGAQEVIEQFSAATEGQWPFYAGRFIRPDLIVSVDVVEGGDEQL